MGPHSSVTRTALQRHSNRTRPKLRFYPLYSVHALSKEAPDAFVVLEYNSQFHFTIRCTSRPSTGSVPSVNSTKTAQIYTRRLSARPPTRESEKDHSREAPFVARATHHQIVIVYATSDNAGWKKRSQSCQGFSP